MEKACVVLRQGRSTRSNRSFLLLFSALALSMGAFSSVQAAINVPASVSPGQVEKRFEAVPTAPVSPDLQIQVPAEQELSQAVQNQLASQKFVLSSVSLEGASVYKNDEIASLYKEQVGQTISLLDARKIAQKITAHYRNAGYILTQAVVPAQDVTDGVLKIRVVEGFVGEVSVQGEIKSDRERSVIQGYGEAIKAEQPTNMHSLERYLLLINDLPGVTVTGLLRPLAGQVGGAELVLNITEKTFEGSYTIDNRGSRFIGPWQHTAAISVNSLYGMYDHTQLRAFYTLPDANEMQGFELTHDLPLGHEGTVLSLLYSHINTFPGDTLKVLDIRGESNLIEAKVVHPFYRARKENLMGRVLFDYHNTTTDIFQDTSYTEDRLRVLRAGGTYNIVDTARGNNLVDAQLSQGMNILSASENGIDRSNAKGDTDFTKVNMSVSRYQPLPEQFSLLVAAFGQYSSSPLLTDEQFSIGGSEYARAFDAADSLGDHGIAGKAELGYTGNVSLPYLDNYHAYTFYDIGRTWLKEALAGENNKKVRSSTGVGVRFTFTDNFLASFETAFPLIGRPSDPSDKRYDPRFFGSMTARF